MEQAAESSKRKRSILLNTEENDQKEGTQFASMKKDKYEQIESPL